MNDAASRAQKAERIVLVVGDAGLADLAGIQPGSVVSVDSDEVSDDLLSRLAPDIVLSPLLTRSFDALELAERLVGAGFTGRYRVCAPRLPRPDLIRSEVRSLCPDLDFDIIEPPET